MERLHLGDEPVLRRIAQRLGHIIADGLVVGRVRVDPTRPLFRLVRCFFHVLLQPLDEHAPLLRRRRPHRPDSEERLIIQILIFCRRRGLAFHVTPPPLVDSAEPLHDISPVAGDFRKDVQPGSQVLRPLGVVGRGGKHRLPIAATSLLVLVVELFGRSRGAPRIASDFVHAGQWHPHIKRRVLDPLGHHGAGDLLEPAREKLALGNRLRR